jgi:hypothetical protein
MKFYFVFFSESSHHPATNPGLEVLRRQIRSRSLDSYTPAETAHSRNTYNTPSHNPATNSASQTPTTHNSAVTQPQNKPPPFVKNKNSPSLWPKVLVGDRETEQTHNAPVTKRQIKQLPDSRASSGYYSNNTSPLVEYPADITSTQNADSRKAEQKLPRQQKKPSNSDDDLPPLPPPPPPLIPISPLPYMCVSSYREAKTKDENNSDKNSVKPTSRKVHFKSSE